MIQLFRIVGGIEVEDLEKIFKNDDYLMVYSSLERYVNLDDFRERRKKQNELFVKYLKLKHPINENHLYERIAVKMSTIRFSNEVLSYLISSNLDLEYKGLDMFDVPFILKYLLATNIKDKDVMKLYLSKVKHLDNIYFGNSNYRAYTDLCRMNIIAGDFDKAIEVFNNPNYHLINIDYTNEDKIIEFLNNSLNCYVDALGFSGFIEHDMVYQIVIMVKELNLNLDEKRDILKRIIYNNKIKLFNKSCLEFIKDTLDTDDYQEFLNYLSNKIESKEITLFEVLNRNTIRLASLDKEKVLKKEN